MIYRILRSLVPIAFAFTTASLLTAVPLQAQVGSSLVTTRLTQPIDDNAVVTLRGTVHPLANAANDRGAASDSMPLDRIQVVLKRSPAQESALQQLIRDEHTPGAANYHKWLTPAQFGQQFGPSDQDIATVEAWLASKGFNVEKVNPGKQTLEVSGNVAQFRAAFHTQIHQYMVNGETHYANSTNPQIPAALAPVFGGFASLNDFHLKKFSHVLGKASYDAKTNKATPQWTYGNSTGETFVLAPGDFATQYDLPAANSGIDGTGQTVAIVNDTNINIALVNQFRTLFSLPANPPQVIIDGNDPGVDGINNPDGPNYDSGEAYLDVEWSGAVAPKATIDLVVGADTALESGLILAAEHAIYGNVAPVLSISFGFCESGLGSENSFLNNLWEQAAAQGITVTVAAGDGGSAGCDSDSQYYAVNGLAVSGFASTPYNVAVGGTDFYYSDYATGAASIATFWSSTTSQSPATSIIKAPIPEQPWNNSQFGLNAVDYYTQIGRSQATSIGGTGGGASSGAICSTNSFDSSGNCTGTLSGYTKPTWQTGTGVPADHVRDIPDVSLFAAVGLNYSYYPICAGDGDCQPASGSNLVQISGVGGTSAAAPAFAGIMALVNQYQTQLLGSPQRQGQADFVLYPLATQFPAAFHDVAVGTNAVPCAYSSNSANNTPNCNSVANPITVTDPTYGTATEGELSGYAANVGYDRATGLGSVDANVLITDWNKVTFTGTSTTLTPSSTSFAHGTAITVSGTVSGGTSATGSVALMTNSTEPVQQGQSNFAVASGAFSGSVNYLPGGTYDIWGQYSGDGKNAASTSPVTQITVSPENSGIFFNALTPDPSGNGSYDIISSGTTAIPYGTQIILSGLVAPSSQLTAYENCITGASTTCPSFTSPTGTVNFSDNGTAINSAVLNAEGEAEYAIPNTFSVGSHSVTASYPGDASYKTSTAAATTFSVVKATPSIFVTGATSTVAQGQSLTLTVLVEGVGPGVAPTGNVTISGGPSGTPTSATLSPTVDPFYGNAAGAATITIPTTAPTTASAVRPARDGWLAGGGAALACILLFTIPARRRTWRGLLGLIVIALFSVSATIGCGGGSSSSSGGGGGGGGTGGTTTGAYTISVSYAGDTNYSSASGSTSIMVSTPSTLLTSTTSITSTSTSPSTTALLGVNVTVDGVSGKAAPTGTVVLYTGSLSPNSALQAVAVEIAQGTLVAGTGSSSTLALSFNSESLLQGANVLTVLYEGDTNYASSSTTISLSNPLSDFSMIPSNSLVSVPASGSATDTLNLAAANGFSGSVALTCAPAAGITTLACSVNPTSVSLASNSTTAALTITSTGATPGNYQFLITGTSSDGSTVHTLAVTAAVQ